MNSRFIRTYSRGYRFFEFILILYLLHSVPVIGLLTPAFLYAGIMILLYACTFYRVGYNNFLRYFLRSIPLTIILLLGLIRNMTEPDVSLSIQIYSYLQVVILLIVGQHIVEANDTRLAKRLYVVIFLMYIATALTTYIGCQVYPNAPRELATTETINNTDLYDLYRSLNIGGFSFIYQLILIIPLLIGAFKKKVGSRTVIVISFILCSAAIIESHYTTAFIVFLSSLLLFLSNKNFDKRSSCTFLIVCMVFISIAHKTALPAMLRYISSNTQSEDVSSRLNDMVSVLQDKKNMGDVGKISDIDNRYDSYSKSLDAFLDSPVIGKWDKDSCGNHSYLFDSLGLYGSLGLFAYLIMWIGFYKIFLSAITQKTWFGYFFISLFIAIILSVLNPHVFYQVIGIVFPVFIVVFKSETE